MTDLSVSLLIWLACVFLWFEGDRESEEGLLQMKRLHADSVIEFVNDMRESPDPELSDVLSCLVSLTRKLLPKLMMQSINLRRHDARLSRILKEPLSSDIFDRFWEVWRDVYPHISNVLADLHPFGPAFLSLSPINQGSGPVTIQPNNYQPVGPTAPVSRELKRSFSDMNDGAPETPRRMSAPHAAVLQTPHTGRREAGGQFEIKRRNGGQRKQDETSRFMTAIEYKPTGKLFASRVELKDYLAESDLCCNLGLKEGSKSADESRTYYNARCSHKITYIDGFCSLQKKRDGSTCYHCPFTAKATRESDGTYILREPVYSDPVPNAVSHLVALDLQPDEAKRRILVDKKYFVSNCGHVHSLHGIGANNVPQALPRYITQLFGEHKDKHKVRNALRISGLFSDFSDHFDREIKKLSASAAVRTVHKAPRNLLDGLLGFHAGVMARDKVPATDRGAMYVTQYIPGDFGSPGETMIVAMRKWMLRRLIISGRALYIDATFSIKSSSDDKALGATIQDARGKPFPIALTKIRTENKVNYDAFMAAIQKGIGLLRAAEPNLPEHRICRVVLDGLPLGDDEVTKHFGDGCARGMCNFHATSSITKHVKTEIHAPPQERAATKRVVYDISRAPSAYAVVSLWMLLSHILSAVFPDSATIAETIAYVGKMYMSRSRTNSFGWFSTFWMRRYSGDPHGPVASRSNNPIESFWNFFKSKLKLLDALPVDNLSLLKFFSSVLDTFDDSDFRESFDVILEEDDDNIKLLALREVQWIKNGITAMNRELPSTEQRFFLLFHDETRDLLPLDEDQARSLIGEFVNERGAYAELSPNEFDARCELINAIGLLLILNMAHIIEFHPNHLPGTEHSYAYGNCTCHVFGKACLCRHILAVHRLMYDVRWRTAIDSTSPAIIMASLRVDEFMYWPDAEALRKHFKLSDSISLTEWKAAPETSGFFSVDTLTLVDVQEAAEKLGNTQKTSTILETLIPSAADQVPKAKAIAATALKAQIQDSRDRLKLFGLQVERKNTLDKKKKIDGLRATKESVSAKTKRLGDVGVGKLKAFCAGLLADINNSVAKTFIVVPDIDALIGSVVGSLPAFLVDAF